MNILDSFKISIMNRIAVTFIFLLMCTLAMHAQSAEELKKSTWMRMMLTNDTTLNYFEAKKDFAKFVAQHKREEALQRANEKAANNTERKPNEEHLESPEDAAIMAFKQWSKAIKPFVMANGKIMPVEQRLAVINKGK
jgi:hypothetical protein